MTVKLKKDRNLRQEYHRYDANRQIVTTNCLYIKDPNKRETSCSGLY